jgi:hypothetical protein
MKQLFFFFLLFFSISLSFSQEMNNKKMGLILERMSDSIQGTSGQWQFKVNDVFFICVTDSTHNRMRIMSPIAEESRLDETLLRASLIANFHTALDVKYALSEEVLWSVFIHPLKELTDNQVEEAVKQVYGASVTFGTTFSSTNLVFPGSVKENSEEPELEPEKKKKLIKKI